MSFFSDTSQPLICCREVSEYKNKDPRFWTEKDRMEWQANYTSSALHMPKSKILEVSNSISIKDPFRKQILISAVSEIFNVSEEAAGYRLEDFRLIKNLKNNIF